MHPVKLDEGEVALVKQALTEKDWTILPTWKLKYVYQRFTKSVKQTKEIGALAEKKLDGEHEELVNEAQKVFQ